MANWKVAILPSSQGANRYVCDPNKKEANQMNILARPCADRLKNWFGLSVEVPWNTVDHYEEQIDYALSHGCNAFVGLHTDSAPNVAGITGILGLYKDERDRLLAKFLCEWMSGHPPIMGWPIKGYSQRNDLCWLNKAGSMPSVILEVGNHNDPDDCRFLCDPVWLSEFGKVLADGIVAALLYLS